MIHPALITTEKKHEYPILIVDKKGDIGEALAKELKVESIIVFVSRKELISEENIIHVPFIKKIPKIPDNIYSHVFVIDEDLEFAENTRRSFIDKAKKDNSFLIFLTNVSRVNDVLLSSLITTYKRTKTILTGDIFSAPFIYNHNFYINKFIYQAKVNGRIEVPGDGTRQESPVFFDDIITGVLEAVFSEDNKNNLYYLFPKDKISLLDLANLFKKKNENLEISFIKETKTIQENFIPPPEGKYLLKDPYNIEEKIKEIDFLNLNVENLKPKKEYKYLGSNVKAKINLSTILLLLVLFLSLPLISTLLFSVVGINSLYLVKSSFEKNNFGASKTSARVAAISFNLAEKASLVFLEEVSLIGQKSKVEQCRKKISSSARVSEGILSLINASEKLKGVTSGTTKNPESDFNDTIIDFKNAFYVYNKEKDSGIIPSSINKKLADVIKISSATIDFWPDILGFNGQKTYLLLFQNNMELRPGGGFIGSYGLLTLNKGKMQNFKIYDVYDADGQLRAHIEPPYPIRRYLPSVHWYLRDSNFDVDFSKGAVASAIFLNSEMHQPVDGVIGVDLSFIKNLLLITGPVAVPDYTETVNADNFYQITQSHVEKDFFPGSTQKKDFLRSFYNSLQIKLNESKQISYLSLFNVLASSVYEKHVTFAFNNPNQQAVFAVNGWSSALIDDRKDNEGDVNDFIGINEANLGANKVNYFISRSLSQKVNISDDGTVSEDLTVAIKNTAEKNALTKENYKNYLRIIVPLNAKLRKIIIDDKEQTIVDAITDPAVYEKKNFKPPTGLEVYKENQGENTIYGFLVDIQAQDLRIIQIQYDLDKKLDLSNKETNYSLKIFKQPGVDFLPYEFSLSYPESLGFVNGSGGIKDDGRKSLFSSQVLRDTKVTVSLSPK